MSYSVSILPLDLGGFFPTPPPPSMIGRFSAASGATIETVGPTGLTVAFVSAATPPGGSSTLLVTDILGPGDVFRSGMVTVWPSSPGTLTVVSVPVVSKGVPLTTFSAARIAALAAPLVGVVPLPGWVIAMATVLTGGTFIPSGMTIGTITITTAAPNLITATITGTLAFTKFFFFASTSVFTATVTLSITPSGDAVNKGHVFAISVVGSSLNPGFISPGISLTLWMLAPLVAKAASGAIDGAVNGAIMSMVGTALAGSASPTGAAVTLSPTASLCARRITVLPGGVTAQMLVSDLLGPVIIFPAPPLGTMTVAIAPTPVDDVSNTYAVTVVDHATGLPIGGAAVKIHTATPAGVAMTLSGMTNPSGIATFLNATLRYADRHARGPGGHADTDAVAPTLSVLHAGYTPVTRHLL